MKAVTFLSATLLLFNLAGFYIEAGAAPHGGKPASLTGTVMSGDQSVADAAIRLYRAGNNVHTSQLLGSAVADADGHFSIDYFTRMDTDSVYYLIAEGSKPVRLAAVLDSRNIPSDLVINERTTVAMAYTMAQFTDGRHIGGKNPGLKNAAEIAQNLVNPGTGELAQLLLDPPNAGTTLSPALNSLANLLAGCVQDNTRCPAVFAAARPVQGQLPRDTLQAITDIARNPGHNAGILFALSRQSSAYAPALDPAQEPTAWILVLLYDADGRLDGPGNIAIDSQGNAWVNNNYVYSADTDPDPPVCGSTKVYKLAPDGNNVPGSPFGGVDGDGTGAGGLYGAGYGIALDPMENAWVTSFGFKGTSCTQDPAPLAVSVAEFAPDGTPLSTPDGDPDAGQPGGFGYDGSGNMSQPQGVLSDRQGDIWIASCVNNSVTRFPRGNPLQVENYTFAGDDFAQPFDVAVDRRGYAWVTGNMSDTVIRLDRKGRKLLIISDGIDKPMGIASDSQGNLWVSNAGIPAPPCPAKLGNDDGFHNNGLEEDGSDNANASVALIRNRGNTPEVTLFDKSAGTRDGLRWPWGIAVDGDDNVWVANFAGRRIMQLCGVNENNCPPGVHTGDPISPDSGYFSDALQRVTAVQIDPSGNVWFTNNWIIEGFTNTNNPGGHEVGVFIGLAAPVKTPLLGTVRKP